MHNKTVFAVGMLFLTTGCMEAVEAPQPGTLIAEPAQAQTPLTAPAAPVLALDFEQTKTFEFSWTDVVGADEYRLFENPDGASGFTQISQAGIGVESIAVTVPLHLRVNAQYYLQSCNAGACSDSPIVSVSGALTDSIGYFKASETRVHNQLGYAVSINSDGDRLAVGARFEANSGTGVINAGPVNGDTAALGAGAVYLFSKNGTVWEREAYIKASNTGGVDLFGSALHLSGDGLTLAVGAHGEDSAATGILDHFDVIQVDNSVSNSGAVYVFTRHDADGPQGPLPPEWNQEAYIKADKTGAGDQFGFTVALDYSGDTLAVGAKDEDSSTGGIFSDLTSVPDDNMSAAAGAVYVFNRDNAGWHQQAFIKASNVDAGDCFGCAISLSADDGDTLVVGAWGEDSSATAADVALDESAAQADNPAGNTDAGAAYVFNRDNSGWHQQAYLKASNTDDGDLFGNAVTVSGDGDTIAVAAYGEDSDGSSQMNNSASGAGAVYVLTRVGGVWGHQAYLKASNAQSMDYFGNALSISPDGSLLAIAAYNEDSQASGVHDTASHDNSLENAGSVFVYTFDGNWSQQSQIKASNAGFKDFFGQSVSVSFEGHTMAVGAHFEDSNATGVNNHQHNNGVFNAGAVYLY